MNGGDRSDPSRDPRARPESSHASADDPYPGLGEPSPDTPELPNVSIGPHFEMHPVVFPVGALIVGVLVALTFLIPSASMSDAFSSAQSWIGNKFGWLYVASLSGFLAFAAWLALGRYSRVRLGRDDEPPEFGRLTWFAMLFSAGMGIGLVFWSVAEPIYHFQSTPPGIADGLAPSRVAMAVTIFHWGLHPWALYAFVALALAYFGFRHGMPLGFRSLLHPLLGDRVWGRTGDAIDVLAIVATLTGVATSLGIGAQQVNAGLAFLFGVPLDTTTQVLLIAGITGVATVSVVLGLGTGIRRLSELNMALAGVLMITVVFGGGLTAFLASTVENTGAYLQLLPFNSFRTGATSSEGRAWLNSWTVFYWAWWIAWSPFVGMFIARVSRGRTIREFIAGVLLVPTAVGIAWLTAFGSTTLREHDHHVHRLAAASPAADAAILDELPEYRVRQTDAEGAPLPAVDGVYPSELEPLTAVDYLSAPIVNDDATAVIDPLPTVLFALLDGLFGGTALVAITAGIATLCIILFFVTSSDSASMVIDILASGGNPDPPVGTRLFWAVTEGAVAAALLVAGGLQALQAASITAALPFTIILLLALVSLTRALRKYEGPSRLPR